MTHNATATVSNMAGSNNLKTQPTRGEKLVVLTASIPTAALLGIAIGRALVALAALVM